MNAIEVNNLSYRFGSNSVLEDISFIVEEGDILGLIGPNGAGKTTLFSSMLGLLHDYDGSIKIFGEDIRKSKKMLKNVGYIQQKRAIETQLPSNRRGNYFFGCFRAFIKRENNFSTYAG